jgi:hypothetical protein
MMSMTETRNVVKEKFCFEEKEGLTIFSLFDSAQSGRSQTLNS